MFNVLAAVLIAFALDYIFSEPKRFHPLVGFGLWASTIEAYTHKKMSRSVFSGAIAWSCSVIPWVLLALILHILLLPHAWLHTLFMSVILYLTIGWRSLVDHARAIQKPLEANDLPSARLAVSMIVSRDTEMMCDNEIAIATTESVLENGADAIFSALFWFVLLGVPGVVLYRLSNTLDAMWGYKNERYLDVGKTAARIDDALNLIPARLTALLYAVSSFNKGSFKQALQCWRTQAKHCSSPNGGPVMCAGAGAIHACLGGRVIYHGETVIKPAMGVECSSLSSSEMIDRACSLVNAAVWVTCGVVVVCMGVLL